jgi:hypothetical protein
MLTLLDMDLWDDECATCWAEVAEQQESTLETVKATRGRNRKIALEGKGEVPYTLRSAGRYYS